MTTAAPAPPPPVAVPQPPAPTPPPRARPSHHAFTAEQYDRMVEVGILGPSDPVEFIDGYVVDKMPSNPPHAGCIIALNRHLIAVVPPGWQVLPQLGVRLVRSRPEPDLAVARGDAREYFTRLPLPADLGLVVEVADSSLAYDQDGKARVYARDRVPVYWVVNLPERRVEVYTDPTGPGDDPRYATARQFPGGAAVPVELDGQTVGSIPVNDLLP